jgi:Bacterial Ig-like domain (group 3)
LGATTAHAHRHPVRFSWVVTLATMILAALLPLFLSQTTFAADDPSLAAPIVSLQASTTQLKTVDPPVVNITGTISDTDQLTYEITVTDPTNTTTPLANGGVADSVDYRWDTTGLADGTYTLTLTVRDARVQTSQASTTVFIDRTDPVATITSAANTSTYGGDSTTVTSTGNVSDTNLVSYRFDVSGNSGYVSTSDTLPASNGSVTYNWDVSAEATGTHAYTISLTAIDSVGNETTTSQTFTLNIDNTAPQIAITNDNENYTGVAIRPDVTTDEDSETLTFSWTADSNNPEVLSFTETAMRPVFRPSVAGTYIFYVEVCDSLGNCTVHTFTFRWRPVFAVPVATTVIDSPAPLPSPPPTGLVATKFNTTSPTALGVQTATGAAQTSSATAPVDNEKPTTKQKKVEATYTTTISDNIWRLLLVLAFGAAGYYAYRNWQLKSQ